MRGRSNSNLLRLSLVIIPFVLALILFPKEKTQEDQITEAVQEWLKTTEESMAFRNIQFLKEAERQFWMRGATMDKDWDPLAFSASRLRLLETDSGKVAIYRPQLNLDHGDTLATLFYLAKEERLGFFSTYKVLYAFDSLSSIRGVFECFGDTCLPLSQSVELVELANLEYLDEQKVSNEAMKQQLKAKAERNREQEKLKKHFEETCLSSWDGSCPDLVKQVKKGLHDPNSFEHVETKYAVSGDHFQVIMTFRATNGFGAKVLTKCSASISADCEVIDFVLAK